MLRHSESITAELLCDPFRNAVVDAKWRVTTLRQRMEKLQVQLDHAVAEEKRVMTAANEFVETGEIPDDFFPDLSTPTRKIRKGYLEQLAWGRHKPVDPDDPKTAIGKRIAGEARKVSEALKAAEVSGWQISDVKMDGFYQTIVLSRETGQYAVPQVKTDAIKAALRDSINAYYAAFKDGKKPDECARIAMKAFHDFEGSEYPDDLEFGEADLYRPDIFKEIVGFDHRRYLTPLRPRGQHLCPFQVRVDGSGVDLLDDFGFGQRNIDWEEVNKRFRKKMTERNSDWEEVNGRLRKNATEGNGKRSGNGRDSGHDPPH